MLDFGYPVFDKRNDRIRRGRRFCPHGVARGEVRIRMNWRARLTWAIRLVISRIKCQIPLAPKFRLRGRRQARLSACPGHYEAGGEIMSWPIRNRPAAWGDVIYIPVNFTPEARLSYYRAPCDPAEVPPEASGRVGAPVVRTARRPRPVAMAIRRLAHY